jgi:hypothetical protein
MRAGPLLVCRELAPSIAEQLALGLTVEATHREPPLSALDADEGDEFPVG